MLLPVRTVAPSTTPVSLEEAKAHLGITDNHDDQIIEGMIAAATTYLDGRDGIVGRAILTQTWREDFSGFSECGWDAYYGYVMRLSVPPVQSITSITYFDANNVSQTVSASIYRLLTDRVGPYVALKPAIPANSWPFAYYSREDAVSITYVTGMATLAKDVPAPIRAAILMLLGSLYENREEVVLGNMAAVAMPFGATALLASYRRYLGA